MFIRGGGTDFSHPQSHLVVWAWGGVSLGWCGPGVVWAWGGQIQIQIQINLLFELQYNYIGNTEYKTKGRVLKVPRPALNKDTF